jgi:hypothetical protein
LLAWQRKRAGKKAQVGGQDNGFQPMAQAAFRLRAHYPQALRQINKKGPPGWQAGRAKSVQSGAEPVLAQK